LPFLITDEIWSSGVTGRFIKAVTKWLLKGYTSGLGEDVRAGLVESLVIDQQVEHNPGFEFWGEIEAGYDCGGPP
jgi:hypothetical protein